jgi:hypothetical protein
MKHRDIGRRIGQVVRAARGTTGAFLGIIEYTPTH